MDVRVDEPLKVSSKLFMVGVVAAFDGGIFDGPVHALDLTIGPRVVWLGQAILDAMLCTNAIEQMACKPRCGSIAVAWRMAELDTVVGQDGMQPVWKSVDQIAEKLASDHAGGLGLEPGEDELGCSVDANEQMEFALFGP